MFLSFTTVIILALSIFIAGILAIFKFSQIRDIYRPFIYLIWLGCINEALSIYLVLHHHYTYVNTSIYSLCESLMLLWFFLGLGLFRKHKINFYLLVLLFIGIWVAETFFANKFGTRFSFYSDIVYSFSIVLLAIGTINNLLFVEKDLLRNPTFLVCMGLIIFFTYQIIERVFRIYGLRESASFGGAVQNIMSLVNFLTNLIYALAVLWMRKRQAFTLQF